MQPQVCLLKSGRLDCERSCLQVRAPSLSLLICGRSHCERSCALAQRNLPERARAAGMDDVGGEKVASRRWAIWEGGTATLKGLLVGSLAWRWSAPGWVALPDAGFRVFAGYRLRYALLVAMLRLQCKRPQMGGER